MSLSQSKQKNNIFSDVASSVSRFIDAGSRRALSLALSLSLARDPPLRAVGVSVILDNEPRTPVVAGSESWGTTRHFSGEKLRDAVGKYTNCVTRRGVSPQSEGA